MGSERAGERDALTLASGKLRGAAIGKGFRAEKAEHFCDALSAGGGIEMANAEGDVAAGGEVREERGLLGDVADRAAAGGNGEAAGGVEERFAIEDDAAFLRRGEAGEETEDGALAGAGGTEDDGPAGCEREGGVESE